MALQIEIGRSPSTGRQVELRVKVFKLSTSVRCTSLRVVSRQVRLWAGSHRTEWFSIGPHEIRQQCTTLQCTRHYYCTPLPLLLLFTYRCHYRTPLIAGGHIVKSWKYLANLNVSPTNKLIIQKLQLSSSIHHFRGLRIPRFMFNFCTLWKWEILCKY